MKTDIPTDGAQAVSEPFRSTRGARAIGTYMLFAVLITFYWCEIIGAHQLALFRNFGARSELELQTGLQNYA